ncbi:MAG: glycosyltransferase family 9 protein [Candidatus Omnitrophota bacterium]|nr:glycosyltransferase family 9 protein [Candidatus Omnitrophota bacterium]
MNPQRILITRTDRLGDVVLSTPVIRHMRRLYPDAYIAFMVRPENRDVVRNNPHLDEVIVYDKYGSRKSFLNSLRFSRFLREKKFDTAIALHPTNRVHIMLRLAGIPLRVGYDRKFGWLLNRKIRHLKQEGLEHEGDYNFDLLEKAGFDISGADRKPYIVTSDEEKRLVDSVCLDQGLGENIIALHVGASCPSKRWDPERFACVADILSEKYGCDIALIGRDETAKLSGRVVSAMKGNAADLTDMLLVGELAEFLSRCRLFISNDSGPVHVAVAVNTPAVVIFGRKDPGLSPGRWGPLGEKDIVLHKDVGCEICLAHRCNRDFECLKAVSIDEVVEAAERILGQA